MMQEKKTEGSVMSVHIGTMGMDVTEESLKMLCDMKRNSLVFIHAAERILRKIIILGDQDCGGDKKEYLSMAHDLLDIKGCYARIAGLSLTRDGENVEPLE